MIPTDLLVGSATAFTVSILLTGIWIRSLQNRLNTVDEQERMLLLKFFFGKDMNKPGEIYVPRYGGLWAVIGIVFGLLVLEAYYVYLQGIRYFITEIFSIVTLLILGGFIGLLDDIYGLPIKHRLLATLLISIPLATVKAGVSQISFPKIGKLDLGIYYSLLLVPIGIMGASNAFNMLAGYNGLEAGMASIILSGYALYAFHHGKYLSYQLAVISLAGVLGFLYWNRYPARTFPGNTFTYAVGALLAAIVIVDNFEKFGVTLFALYFLELALFLTGLANGVYKQNFGKPSPTGELDLPYEKIYSVTHLAIYILKKLGIKSTEKNVVILILGIQLLLTITALVITW
ncbi:MAG: glycosyl transferase family 4 [Desulfurococcales archaeon]|nr:glycosyl transferase family 4 [Desulfurococcales archaeon]